MGEISTTNFCIITHVPHGYENSHYYAYAPYVREMNIWLKYCGTVDIVAPLGLKQKTAIDADYVHDKIQFSGVKGFSFTSLNAAVKSVLDLPIIRFVIFNSMRKADHIHLRCPGNMGLLGCIIQVFFPKKKKTAKYAGNWDPKAAQPLSYRIQKWILNNTLLTKNMTVLVYGRWDESSTNIRPFFTATYREQDKIPVAIRPLEGKIKFLFVGTLSKGKRPFYTIQLIEKLLKSEFDVSLDMYGEGKERQALEEYISKENLNDAVRVLGNRDEATIRKAYQESHFILLPSKSEGWPKVIAEAMFWGCMPIASGVSCVPFMLDFGKRGLLLDISLKEDAEKIAMILKAPQEYASKVQESIGWSRQFTLDLFEKEIKSFLHQ